MAFTQYIKQKPNEWKLDTRSPIQDMLFSIDNESDGGSEKMTSCKKCRRHTYEVFQVFCSKTSLHGLQYVGEKSHVLLRLFWALIIFLAVGSSIYHISQLYKKWDETPVMVTLAPRVKNIEEVYFPAVTICAPRILTLAKKRKFLADNQANVNESNIIVEKFCNTSIYTEAWDSSSMEDYQMLENYTRLSCETLLQGARFSDGTGKFNKTYPNNVISSKVLFQQSSIDCCTFNGLSEQIMYRNLNFTRNETNIKDEKNLKYPTGIGIRNAFTYKLESRIHCPQSFEFKVSVHHPTEEPNVEGDGLVVKTGAKISYTIKPQHTEASDALKSLKLSSRGCQFSEDVQLRFFKHYSQHNCMLDCLANYTITRCDCLPPYLPENNGTWELCRESKLKMCFTPALDEFRSNVYPGCNCDQPCADTMYLVTTQYLPSTKNVSTVEFDVYFTEPIFFSYYRSELYGLSDFLSSCGGLLGLFMGFSFISMIELFYFSLFGGWRLFTAMCKRNR